MANIFKVIKGVMGDIFQIGGPSGNQIKTVGDGLAVRDSSDSNPLNLTVKQATGLVSGHSTAWQDLRDVNPLIEFSFAGSSPPGTGANAGTYGFCHTSGGAYNAGQIYYDTGATLLATKVFVGMTINTSSVVTGTISLIANGIYVAHTSSAPFTWTLKGDGAADSAGYVKQIKLALTTAASTVSTTSIPSGAKVLEVSTDVEVAYNNAATLEVIVDGSVSNLTVQSSAENSLLTAAVYKSEPIDLTVNANTEGPIRATITGGPSQGSGELVITYTSSFLT